MIRGKKFNVIARSPARGGTTKQSMRKDCFTLTSFGFAMTLLILLSGCGARSEELPKPQFNLADAGTEDIVDYARYGQFSGIGTKDYSYAITDRKGLSDAVGEGIYPNNRLTKDPLYQELKEAGSLEGSQWNFVNNDDQIASFYKWAACSEAPGTRLFYTARALEMTGNIKQAIKAYYAILVFYPRTISWTYWKTPWYVGQVAIDKLYFLTQKYPQLGMKLVGARVKVANGFDTDAANDAFEVNPGSIIKCDPSRVIEKVNLNAFKAVKTIGQGNIKIVQYENGRWRMFVDGKPFIIKAISYSPNKIGQSPDDKTLQDWSLSDENKNGKIDAPYDAWVEKNKAVGDFKLMKDMGANAIRIYHWQLNQNTDIFRDLYKTYGIRTIMGNFIGVYAIGSGASWYRGTDYSDPLQRQNMLDNVKEMAAKYKDEEFLLAWMLGNENNYGVANNSRANPEAYYKFVNDAAKLIKSMDSKHPVMICNGDTLFLDVFAKNCPDVDVFGCNSYRGEYGFSDSIWQDIKDMTGKPALITEYGISSYIKGKSPDYAQEMQSKYLEGAWKGIYYNNDGYGAGNAIGGVLFEWVDEWWKAYGPDEHDVRELWIGPFPGGYCYEEWVGITSQGSGENSPFERELRKAYFMYKKIWNQN